MPQVPYSPISDVQPQNNPTPSIHVDTPGAAFGTNISQAVSTLGQTADQVGNEIFTRALAMQQIHNETEARNADTAYDQHASKLYADFISQQGNNAGPEALDAYQKSLDEVRNSTRDSLSNPASARIFDQSSASTMNRLYMGGAAHSGQQVKSAAIGAANSSIQTATDLAMSQPGDEASFQAGLAKSADAVRARGVLLGHDENQIQQDIINDSSSKNLARINGFVNQGKPEVAQALLTKALADGSIRGEQIGQVAQMVQKGLYTTGARNTVHMTLAGTNFAMGQGPVDIDRAADAIGGYESGGQYSIQGKAVASGQYAGQQALGKYQVMPGNLASWLKDAGMPPMTPQQYLANPAAQDQLFKNKFGQLMAKTGNFNDAASMWFTGKPVAQAGNVSDVNGTTVPAYLTGTNAILAKNASIQDKVAAVRAQADKIAPNSLMSDYAEQRMISENAEQQRMQQQKTNETWNTLADAVNPENGRVPANIDQLRAQSPQAGAAFDSLSAKDQLKFQTQLRTQFAHDDTDTPIRQRNMELATGMYHDDPEKFSRLQLINEDLKASDRKTLVGMQKKIFAGGTADPRLGQAMNYLGPSLTAAKIDKATDEDGNTRFQGALSIAIDQFQQENNRYPQRKDIVQMGAQLLQTHPEPGKWWGTNDVATYAEAPSDAQVKQIKGLAKWNGRDPSDQEVQSTYTQYLYNKYYGKKKAAQ